MSHEELVGLAKTHFSGVSFEYENDAIPVLSPCRFTGSEVRLVLQSPGPSVVLTESLRRLVLCSL